MPIPTGSVVDLTVETERPTSVDEVTAAFADAAGGGLEGILQYSEEPIVSSDVIDETCVKVLAWYDNERGYATRLGELAKRVLMPVAA